MFNDLVEGADSVVSTGKRLVVGVVNTVALGECLLAGFGDPSAVLPVDLSEPSDVVFVQG